MKNIVLVIFIGLITFFFLGAITPVSAIEETVTCIFENSDEEQKCFAGYGAESFWFGDQVIRFSCTGVGKCLANVNFDDKIIEKYNLQSGDLDIYWQNMKGCRGEFTRTVIDGSDDTVRFDCGPYDASKSKGFLYASWECMDGAEGTAGDGNECRRLGKDMLGNIDGWHDIASEYCYSLTGSGYLKSLNPSQECYYESPFQGVVSRVMDTAYWEGTDLPTDKYWPDGTPKEKPNDNGVCESGGCSYNDLCSLTGSVIQYHYCSTDGEFVEQLNNGESCDGDFQCVSGLCKDNKCETPSFFTRLVNLFKRLFN